jgi:hypothetical protein
MTRLSLLSASATVRDAIESGTMHRITPRRRPMDNPPTEPLAWARLAEEALNDGDPETAVMMIRHAYRSADAIWAE